MSTSIQTQGTLLTISLYSFTSKIPSIPIELTIFPPISVHSVNNMWHSTSIELVWIENQTNSIKYTYVDIYLTKYLNFGEKCNQLNASNEHFIFGQRLKRRQITRIHTESMVWTNATFNFNSDACGIQYGSQIHFFCVCLLGCGNAALSTEIRKLDTFNSKNKKYVKETYFLHIITNITILMLLLWFGWVWFGFACVTIDAHCNILVVMITQCHLNIYTHTQCVCCGFELDP